jgi:ArsR family transcriptional regulator
MAGFAGMGQGEAGDLPFLSCFHIIGTMKNSDAVTALAALAQESRLAVFRLLVRHSPDGLTPGIIGEQLELPAPTLSFHLKTLAQAGLVTAVQEGRYVRYRAEIPRINVLISFLTEDCCAGDRRRCIAKGE